MPQGSWLLANRKPVSALWLAVKNTQWLSVEVCSLLQESRITTLTKKRISYSTSVLQPAQVYGYPQPQTS